MFDHVEPRGEKIQVASSHHSTSITRPNHVQPVPPHMDVIAAPITLPRRPMRGLGRKGIISLWCRPQWPHQNQLLVFLLLSIPSNFATAHLFFLDPRTQTPKTRASRATVLSLRVASPRSFSDCQHPARSKGATGNLDLVGWLNHLSQYYIVKMGSSSPNFRGENEKQYFKPPPIAYSLIIAENMEVHMYTAIWPLV